MRTSDDLAPAEAQAAVDEYRNGSSAVRDDETSPPPEPDLSEVAGDDDEDPEEVTEKKERPRQIDQLVRLVEAKAKLFHGPNRSKNDFYADIKNGEIRETHQVGSPSLSRWMTRLYFSRYSKWLGQTVIDSANGVLRAIADATYENEVSIRTAARAGKYYIDLGDDTWRAIEVAKDGWKVVSNPPVRFRRAPGNAALCVPERGGSIEMLRKSLNTKDDDSFVMVVAWMLAALRSVGPYPILVIGGEQGSAKSTMARIVRSFVDPSTVPLSNLSREERELFITASNSWMLAFDNCSTLTQWTSDALCKMATGGGFRCRSLFTDGEEAIFNAMRPICMNGITDFIEKGDLAQRALFVQLQPVSRDQRKTEGEVFDGLEKVRPKIFGALLDAMVTGLQRVDGIKLNEMSRMAEFEVWASACEPDYTDEDGTFSELYAQNAKVGVASVIESSPVALAIRAFAGEIHTSHDGDYWMGNATELLKKLRGIVDEDTLRDREWPKSAKALGRQLARLAPVLRQSGIPVDRAKRTGTCRGITIWGVDINTET